MKKTTLIPALAIAVVAATSLSLPATASAAPFKHEETTLKRGEQPREAYTRPVHNVERRYSDSHNHGQPRWEQSRYQHDYGHHYGHQHRYTQRHEHRPIVRYEPRVEYRTVERYQPRVEYRTVERYQPRVEYRTVERYDSRPSDDVRVRISYDLHL